MKIKFYNTLIYVLIFIVAADPFMHDNGYFIKIPTIGGFNIIDFIVLFLIFWNLFFFKNYFFLLFILYILFWGVISLIKNSDPRIVSYAFRPILYMSFFYFNLKKINIVLVENTLIAGMIFYIFISFYILLFDPVLYLLNTNVEEGRIAFHNDLFLIPISLILFNRRFTGSKISFIELVFLALIFIKLLVSMSRGLIILYIFTHLLSLVFHKKYNIKLLFRTFLIICSFYLILFYFAPFFSTNLFDLSQFKETLSGRFFNYNDSDWQETHISSRFPMYLLGLKLAFNSPIFGLGIGNSYYVAEWSKEIFYVDSSFITLLIFLGITGFAFFYNFFFRYLSLLFNYKKYRNNFIFSKYIPIYIFLIAIFFINSIFVASPVNILLIFYLSLINSEFKLLTKK